VSLIRALATSLLPTVSPGEPDDDQPAQRQIAGRKFRRFGRMGADGRVITYTDQSAAQSCNDDRYLGHEIDTQTYGKPLPISGQFFGQAGWGQQ
jgi:hypothetical protein